jgi:glutamyl-tRNA synthetase
LQNKALAELLFPGVKKTIKDWFDRYLKRKTTAYRIGPSPTGYVHIGTVGMALINSYLAKDSGGVFYLRLEDTDDKRAVADAAQNMKDTFSRFGIKFDEGAFDGGKYGPYVQSERTEIYQTFAKYLVENGNAYPCFCTAEELDKIREKQQKNNEKTGYYGKYAKCKNLSYDEIKQKLINGEKWVLRADFSKWNVVPQRQHTQTEVATGAGQQYQHMQPEAAVEPQRLCWNDGVKGKMSLPAEINDPIILKSTGTPPYNLAHVVDDTLMGTTAVLRGEEWLVSTAQHLQLFDLFGLPAPQYIHLPTISINDNGKKRKLSKRKDKIAVAMNLVADGYPVAAITEYLLTLLNTDFELWRTANPNAELYEFNFKIEKIGTNNPLFDVQKLNDISKNVLAKYDCETITAQFNEYYETYKPFALTADEKKRVEEMLCVERGGFRPRKDLIKYSDIPTLYDYMLDGFATAGRWSDNERKILADYATGYAAGDDKTVWFDKIKTLAAQHKYATDKNEYKQNPEKYNGTTADFVAVIRTAITGRDNTPDLWRICQILGEPIIKRRCFVI